MKELPYVGCWAYYCCHRDLVQITTQEDLDDYLEMDEECLEDEQPPHKYHHTKREALECLKFGSSPEDLAGIEASLAELEGK